MGDRVADRHVEPGRLGLGRHPGVGVHPGGLDPGAAERFEQLATPAADVQHRRVAREQLDVGLDQLRHALTRAAEDVLEPAVGVGAVRLPASRRKPSTRPARSSP